MIGWLLLGFVAAGLNFPALQCNTFIKQQLHLIIVMGFYPGVTSQSMF